MWPEERLTDYHFGPRPEQMTDGAPAGFEPFESGYDPGQPVDRAIMATRKAVFPLHGLMPL